MVLQNRILPLKINSPPQFFPFRCMGWGVHRERNVHIATQNKAARKRRRFVLYRTPCENTVAIENCLILHSTPWRELQRSSYVLQDRMPCFRRNRFVVCRSILCNFEPWNLILRKETETESVKDGKRVCIAASKSRKESDHEVKVKYFWDWLCTSKCSCLRWAS